MVIFALTELFKHDSKLSPGKRKALNFTTDLIRVATYTLLVYFAHMFIRETTADDIMYLAFWIFIAGYVLFIIRKVFKWSYYFIGRGKTDYRPWSSLFVSKDHSLIMTTEEKKKVEDVVGKVINDIFKTKREGVC